MKGFSPCFLIILPRHLFLLCFVKDDIIAFFISLMPGSGPEIN